MFHRALPLALAAAMALPSTAQAQTASPAAIARLRALMASPAFAKAKASFAADWDRIVQDVITLTEIPAPPFHEAERAKAYAAMLQAHGLSDVEIDAEGNASGLRRGTRPGGPLLVIAAHLDTVFPPGTDVKVRREGDRLAIHFDRGGVERQYPALVAQHAEYASQQEQPHVGRFGLHLGSDGDVRAVLDKECGDTGDGVARASGIIGLQERRGQDGAGDLCRDFAQCDNDVRGTGALRPKRQFRQVNGARDSPAAKIIVARTFSHCFPHASAEKTRPRR